MPSLILAAATRGLFPLILLFSVFLLLRGHNDPGGGFIGGLAAACAFALWAVAEGVAAARERLRVDPRALVAAGLCVALTSGLLAMLDGAPFLTGLWPPLSLPVVGKVGTPLLFDLGVYLVVIGIATTILFELMEER
jgi:multicomponent Na+:H+ antiporter subunit B